VDAVKSGEINLGPATVKIRSESLERSSDSIAVSSPHDRDR
jgi:hypothetical protein